MIQMGDSWYVGTWTLVGAIIGMTIGFIIHQPPPAIALGLALGAGLDTWLNRENQ